MTSHLDEVPEMQSLSYFLTGLLAGVSVGTTASLASARLAARRRRSKPGVTRNADGDRESQTEAGCDQSTLHGRLAGVEPDAAHAAYPAPVLSGEFAGRSARVLPSRDELPPIVSTAVEWAWSGGRYRRGDIVVVPEKEMRHPHGTAFVLGDLHGDAASLRRILEYVLSSNADFRVVFLGDLVDRATGPEMLECARLFIWAAKRHPGRFLWIRGNHDFLARNETNGRFCTSVEPHEFADCLDGNPDLLEEGVALGEIMATLPVGAVLGNVWLSHGGVLQDDDLGTRAFTGFSSMTDEMKHDLVWSRMRDVPSRLANRVGSGAEVGFRQAEAFVRRIVDTDGVEIEHIVCAHQHESRDGFGYMPYDRCFTRGLTCQCVCSFTNKSAMDGPATPVALRLDCGKTPVPVLFAPSWRGLESSQCDAFGQECQKTPGARSKR